MCDAKTEVYSRVVGYYRPVQQWNVGKRAEFVNRKLFKEIHDEKMSQYFGVTCLNTPDGMLNTSAEDSTGG